MPCLSFAFFAACSRPGINGKCIILSIGTSVPVCNLWDSCFRAVVYCCEPKRRKASRRNQLLDQRDPRGAKTLSSMVGVAGRAVGWQLQTCSLAMGSPLVVGREAIWIAGGDGPAVRSKANSRSAFKSSDGSTQTPLSRSAISTSLRCRAARSAACSTSAARRSTPAAGAASARSATTFRHAS